MKKRRPAKHSAKPSVRSRKKQIEMRMYNVGFGDCFLLRIPTDDGERRMLVDCGYHSQGQGQFTDAELVKQIKADLDGAPLNVVVATHRHQDHISGFGEKELWKDIAVEEVWLPFTANPSASNDEPALKAWEGLMNAVCGLWDPSGRLTLAASAALDVRDPEERAAAEFMLWNARANTPGIENLLSEMKRADARPAKRRFLPEEKDRYPSQFVTPTLPGITIHVLGPPRDASFRKQMKIPSTWGFEQTLSFAASDDVVSPFSSEWQVPVDRLPPRRPFLDQTLQSIRLFNDDLVYAAKALEGFLNGESLVLLLEIGKARLLLPGDAEVGTWTKILANQEALALAASATFLKVGHHGSHNATPIAFVRDHLAKKTPAVISTQEGEGKYRNGIPFGNLLDELKSRSMPYCRSDQIPKKAQGVFTPEPAGRWVDCSIPC